MDEPRPMDVGVGVVVAIKEARMMALSCCFVGRRWILVVPVPQPQGGPPASEVKRLNGYVSILA